MIRSASPQLSASSSTGSRSSIEALLYSVLILGFAYGIWRWSVVESGVTMTPAAAWGGVRLLFASLCISAVGHVVLRLVEKRCFLSFETSEQRSLPLSSQMILSLVVGQFSCFLWILLRSGISGTTFYLVGKQLPITRLEVLALLLGVALMIAREYGTMRKTGKSLSASALRTTCVALLLLSIVTFSIGAREIPRYIAMSSDPDQHAFWAAQVLRLGIIPRDLGVIGIGPFQYPGGFAALNAVWCGLSGLSPVEMVTIQPLLQYIFAGFVCASFAPLTTRGKRSGGMRPLHANTIVLTLAFMLTFLYWFFAPYGLQLSSYHSEGTPRVSTGTLTAIMLLCWICLPTAHLSRSSRNLRIWAATTVVAITATFNPIVALTPAIICALIIIDDLMFTALTTRSARELITRLLHISAPCAVAVALTLCDPYFSERVISALQSLRGGAHRSPPIESAISTAPIFAPTQSFFEWINIPQVISLLSGGSFGGATITWQAVALVVVLTALWVSRARNQVVRFMALLLLVAGVLYCGAHLNLPGDMSHPNHLIPQYTVYSTTQWGGVLGMILLVSGCTALSTWGRHFTWLVGGVSAWSLALLPPQSPAALNPYYKLTPRVSTCGAMGCVTEEDREVIDFTTRMGDEIISKYPNLSYRDAPKVLILGYPAILGIERWIFPPGASRVLPLASPLPVAFFYGRGSPDWTYKNYIQRVCHRFDREWLRSRNVRYLFIPTGAPGCLRQRELALEGSTILFEKGEARLIQLF